MVYYRQCMLVKGATRQTSWIPEQYAIVNKVLKLREAGIWDNGWIVETVSQTRLSEKQLPDFHKERKRHRKATGDDLPKVTNVDA
jgi:hypothetical protein